MSTPGFNWRDSLHAGFQGLAGAAGNQDLYDQIQQHRDQKQQAALQMQQLSLSKVGQAQQKVTDMLVSGTHPETGAPLSQMERANLSQTYQTLNDYAHQIATGQPPPKQSAPPPAPTITTTPDENLGGNVLPGKTTTVAQMTPEQSVQHARDAIHQFTANIPANPYAQKYNQVRSAFPDIAPEEAMHMALGTTPKSLQEKLISQWEAAGMSPEQALQKYTEITHPDNGKVQSAEPLEKGGVIYGVKDPATGKEYLSSQMSAPDTPQNVKEIYKTITAAQDQKEGEKRAHEARMAAQFQATQERIERMHNSGQGAIGTWSVVEDENGNPQLFNSKTGERKDAPAGMHKSGYFAKQVAPLEAATENIKGYMDGGVFTGPGDLDLQHQYFTATQPATGFRMTKVQQDILADSQSFINKMKAGAAHFTGGTIFSPEQRKQIADEAQKAIAAKKRALSIGVSKLDQAGASPGGGGDPQRQVGDTKKFPNGKTGVWDGQGWVAQ